MTGKPKYRETMHSDRTLLLIYINVILYATCFQIQRPLEPFLVDKLIPKGDSSGEYARLQSFFSIMQTVGSLIAGRFLDNFGVKGGFIVSFLASAACYALLSQATTLNILYLSKVPTIFQAGFLCAQMAASQATNDGTDRVTALGRLTMSYTIGSVIGPTIGGFLGASGDYYLGAKLAVAGSLLSVVITLFMPDPVNEKVKDDDVRDDKEKLSDKDSKGHTSTSTTTKSSVIAVPSIMAVVSVVWLFLSTKIITSVANAMGAAAFPLILKNIYSLNESSLGLTMSCMSACNSIVNGFLLGPILSFVGGSSNMLIGYCVFGMSILSALQACVGLPHIAVLSYANGLYEYIGLSFLLSMIQYVLSTTITSESTTRVGQNAKGTLLGLEHSLFAAARVFAPQAGVWLLQEGGVSAVSGACAAVFIVVYIAWQCLYTEKVLVEQVIEERKER